MRRIPDQIWVSPTGTVLASGTLMVAVAPSNADLAMAVYIASTPISRFLTGFHTVREPICHAAQSAQPVADTAAEPWRAPSVAPPWRAAQTLLSTTALLAL